MWKFDLGLHVFRGSFHGVGFFVAACSLLVWVCVHSFFVELVGLVV